jgi:hypothetical protein
VYPSTAWQEKAAAITKQAQIALADFARAETVAWLLEQRGLTYDTITAARLGWVDRDQWFAREQWGLVPDKKLWLPAGLLIPCLADGGAVMRLRVRRPNPGNGQRYVVVSGGYGGPVGWDLDRPTVLIVESELDGLLCRQEAPESLGVVALTSAQIKPPAGLYEILAGKRLLVALDADEAGDKAAEWWLAQYRNARRLRPAGGKDPGDMHQAGVNVKEWLGQVTA